MSERPTLVYTDATAIGGKPYIADGVNYNASYIVTTQALRFGYFSKIPAVIKACSATLRAKPKIPVLIFGYGSYVIRCEALCCCIACSRLAIITDHPAATCAKPEAAMPVLFHRIDQRVKPLLSPVSGHIH